jgi:hypothetical protein
MNNDLISRSALLESYGLKNAVKYGNETAEQQHNSYSTLMLYEIADMINEAPAVDAEVVRCKDCMHRGIVSECPMCYTEDSYDEDYGYDYWDVDKTVDEGFCHCGEVDAEVEG